MRLIGLLLLIAVLIVGFGMFKSVLSPQAPVSALAVAPQPAPVADPRVDELEAQVAALESQLAQAQAQPAPAAQPTVPATATAVPQPTEDPSVEPATGSAAVDTSRPQHGCVATPGNAHAASPTLTVAEGHLLSVQWWEGSGAQQQSVLPAGTWVPKAGVHIGAWWDYPACDIDTVVNQAVASNGSVTDPGNGFAHS
jgi:hypothetical protein